MQDDKKFVEGGEDEGMGKADIRYGDTTVFVQHIKVRKHDIEYLKTPADSIIACPVERLLAFVPNFREQEARSEGGAEEGGRAVGRPHGRRSHVFSRTTRRKQVGSRHPQVHVTHHEVHQVRHVIKIITNT